MIRWLLRQWHRFTLGRTATSAGVLRGIVAEYNSDDRYGFNGLTYKLDFLPTALMVITEEPAMSATASSDDLRDARCSECGARCVPGESHLEHNAGWRKKVLMWDWHEIAMGGYRGWDLVDPGGGHDKHPPCVKLAIKNKADKASEDITREFDDIAVGRFYSRDWSRSGSPFVRDGETYDAGWWFEKREDAYVFIRRYGGIAG